MNSSSRRPGSVVELVKLHYIEPMWWSTCRVWWWRFQCLGPVIHGDGDPGDRGTQFRSYFEARWWFQKLVFFFIPTWGEMIQFDEYFEMAWKPTNLKRDVTSLQVRVEYGFDKWYSLLWSEFVDMGRGISCLWNTSTTKSKFEILPSCLDLLDKKMQHILFWDVFEP